MDLFSVIGDVIKGLSGATEAIIRGLLGVTGDVIVGISTSLIIFIIALVISMIIGVIGGMIVGTIVGVIVGAIIGAIRGNIALGIQGGSRGGSLCGSQSGLWITLTILCTIAIGEIEVKNVDAGAMIIVSGIIGGGIIGAIRSNIALGGLGESGCGCMAVIIGTIPTVVIADMIGVKNVDAGAIITVSVIIGGIFGTIGSTEDLRPQAKVIPKAKTREKRAIPPLHAFNVPMYNYKYLPKLETPEGYVYFVQDVEVSKHYKIGRTTAPQTHLKRLSIDLPIKVKVIAILQTNNAPVLEQKMHKFYAAQRIQGEWFALTDRQIQEIRSI